MATTTNVTASDGKIVIETARLVLRAARDSDVDGLHECFSDGIAMKYWSTLPHQDKQVTSQWVAKMRESTRNGISDFAIELKTGDRPCIGKVGVWDGNEIGFIIARQYWKLGLAREAVTAVLDLFFGVHNSDPSVVACLIPVFGDIEKRPSDIVADVDPRNDLSLKALAKLGFEVYETKEKTLQVGQEWVDSVYLRLRKDTWLKARASS